ncbi:MAG TPA: MaoC/PaaZ C-terminal domain-containing protein [Micromonosporaceae bacterium]
MAPTSATVSDGDVTEIAKAPAPRAGFRRAIRSSLRRHGDAPDAGLPSTRLMLRGVDVAIDRLADYDRVCGFRLSNALPVTYPHVLTFPIALQLMTATDFPFPVAGLVHVGNRITQARPIRLGERLDITVHAESLRAHPRGQQFDLVATATIDDREVWHGVSTYLRRMEHAQTPTTNDGDRSTGRSDADADADVVNAGPPTAIWHVDADTGRAYAAVSGDRNPIHVSRIGARAFGFRRPIAHGMWTMARAVAALEGRLAETYTVDVAFRRPVPLPSIVEWRARRDDGGWTIGVVEPGTGRRLLTGSIAPA